MGGHERKRAKERAKERRELLKSLDLVIQNNAKGIS
jgi:hypothetical protein